MKIAREGEEALAKVRKQGADRKQRERDESVTSRTRKAAPTPKPKVTPRREPEPDFGWTPPKREPGKVIQLPTPRRPVRSGMSVCDDPNSSINWRRVRCAFVN